MIISIDTEQMIQMSTEALSAFDEINSCCELANRITEHNDWNCKERDTINELVIQTKAKIHRLYEDIESFSSALTNTAKRFQETENEFISLLQSANAAIGVALSVPTASADISTVPAEMSDYVKENGTAMNVLESYSVGNLTEPLQVCSFSDVNFLSIGGES